MTRPNLLQVAVAMGVVLSIASLLITGYQIGENNAQAKRITVIETRIDAEAQARITANEAQIARLRQAVRRQNEILRILRRLQHSHPEAFRGTTLAQGSGSAQRPSQRPQKPNRPSKPKPPTPPSPPDPTCALSVCLPAGPSAKLPSA